MKKGRLEDALPDLREFVLRPQGRLLTRQSSGRFDLAAGRGKIQQRFGKVRQARIPRM